MWNTKQHIRAIRASYSATRSIRETFRSWRGWQDGKVHLWDAEGYIV